MHRKKLLIFFILLFLVSATFVYLQVNRPKNQLVKTPIGYLNPKVEIVVDDKTLYLTDKQAQSFLNQLLRNKTITQSYDDNEYQNLKIYKLNDNSEKLLIYTYCEKLSMVNKIVVIKNNSY